MEKDIEKSVKKDTGESDHGRMNSLEKFSGATLKKSVKKPALKN
jgi:hypothetical protein